MAGLAVQARLAALAADLRPILRCPRLIPAALLLLGALGAHAQAPAVTCSFSGGVPPTLRASGLSEPVGDVVLVCTGGIPTPAGQPVQTMNVTLQLNTNVTSRLLVTGPGGNWTEALLLLDEPHPASTLADGGTVADAQFPCQSPSGGVVPGDAPTCGATGDGTGHSVDTASGGPAKNVFQARQGQQPNMLTWFGVPFDPPGSATDGGPAPTRTIRLTNIRANANMLGSGFNGLPSVVQAFVSINANTQLTINNPQEVVGFIQQPMQSSLANLTNPCLTTTPTQAGKVVFTEQYPSSFNVRVGAVAPNSGIPGIPLAQNTPGSALFGNESLFFDPGLVGNLNLRGNLGVAGLADTGTRLKATFTNIPNSVSIYVDALATSNASGQQARLVSSEVGPYSPAVPLDSSGRYQLQISNGTATAVWEVIGALSPSAIDTFSFGVYATHAYNPAIGPVSNNIIQVQGDLAPTFFNQGSQIAGTSTSPIPRFASTGTLVNLSFSGLNAPNVNVAEVPPNAPPGTQPIPGMLQWAGYGTPMYYILPPVHFPVLTVAGVVNAETTITQLSVNDHQAATDGNYFGESYTEPLVIQPGYNIFPVDATDACGLRTEVWGVVNYYNSAPVWDYIPPQTWKEGQQYCLSLSATDADGNQLTYAMSSRPSWVQFFGTSFCATPGFGDAHSATLAFTVSDGIAPPVPMTVQVTRQGTPSHIEYISGANQLGIAGQALTATLVVIATDETGNGIAGVPVNFAPLTGGGSVVSSTVYSDSSGLASTTAILGTTAGPQSFVATASFAPETITFAETAGPGAPYSINYVGGSGQSGVAGGVLPQALVVNVADQYGNAVPGVTVDFRPQTVGASVNPSEVTTDPRGSAQSIATLSATEGANSFTASVGNLSGSPILFGASGNPGSVARLQLSATPATTQAGTPFSATVTAYDANGNVATGFNGGVSFTSSDAEAHLPAHAQLTSGAATFSGASALTLNTAGPQTLSVADGSGTLAPSTASITVLAGPAASIALVSGDQQSGEQGAALQQTLKVQVLDAQGNPVAGQLVTFTADGGGSVATAGTEPGGTASVDTDAEGFAQAFAQLGHTAGDFTFTATASANGGPIHGGPISFRVHVAGVILLAPTHLSYISGANQVGVVGKSLSGTLVVIVTDQNGNGISGAGVTFETVSGGGSVVSSLVYSDRSGLAATTAILGTTAGPQSFRAHATFAQEAIAFAQTARPDLPAVLALVGGTPQSAVAGSILPLPLAVKVTDQYGNSVSGVTVDFRAQTARAALNPSEVTTDLSGLAQSIATLAPIAGPNTFTAAASGLSGSPILFNASSVPGGGARLLLAGVPTNSVSGASFSATVTALDANGNIATSFSGAHGAVTFASSDPSAVLPTNAQLTNGTGTFEAAFILNSAGPQTLSVLDGAGLLSPSTALVQVSAGAAASMTRISGDQQSGIEGSSLPQPLKVLVSDANGNPIAGQPVTFAAAGGGSVSTATSPPASSAQALTDTAGIASAFAVLGPTVGDYQFTASASAGASAIPGSPIAFHVSVEAGPTTHFGVFGLPDTMSTGIGGLVTVQALDDAGNIATSYDGAVGFSSPDPLATLPPVSPLTRGSGVFAVTFNTVGVQSIAATDVANEKLTGAQEHIVVNLTRVLHPGGSGCTSSGGATLLSLLCALALLLRSRSARRLAKERA